jgi:hypothetical protein
MKKYKLNDIQNQLIGVLKIGIEEFYNNDAESLFSQEIANGKDIDERAMVGCIYRYMYANLNNVCYPHIDIEYNRMQRLNKDEVDKSISLCSNCRNEEMKKGGITCYEYAKTVREVMENVASNEDEISMRPDIIIHRRNSGDNGLIVEFKKLGKTIKYDKAKVAYATCKFSPLHYKIGAVVQLGKKCATVYTYSDGKIVGETRIGRNGGL